MTWWAAFGLAAYATHALWQSTALIKARRVQGLIFAPLILVKLGVVVVAFAYWHAESCTWFKNQHWHGAWLAVPAICAYLEANLIWHLIEADIEQLRAHKWFYVRLSAQILVSAVLPAIILFIAYLVLGLNRCAV